MPTLANPKHERFAQGLASGKTATEAYELAGYRRDSGAASRLSGNDSVRERVASILSVRETAITQSSTQAIEETALTKEWVISMLKLNVERAMTVEAVLDKDGAPTGEFTYNGHVANRALELLGKERGMFIDRSEVGAPGEFDQLGDAELHERLAKRASELGITLPGNETSH